MPGKVREIPAHTNEPIKYVVIYARVSSNRMEQLESLKTQISGLTKFVANHQNWKLIDVYIDIASSKKGSVRPEFNKMLNDCKAGLTDIVVVKNVSRFGRDTVKVLDAVNELKEADVRVIFIQDDLDTAKADSAFYLSIIASLARAENDSRSADINYGLSKKAKNGTLGFYNKLVYGYTKDENGNLIINEDEAAVVRLIFDLYLKGASIGGIIKELKDREIKSSRGKDTWSKGSVEKVLSREKYTGVGIVNIGGENGCIYKVQKNHPAIISKEVFNATQRAKVERSNMVEDESGKHRRHTKYSSKKH